MNKKRETKLLALSTAFDFERRLGHAASALCLVILCIGCAETDPRASKSSQERDSLSKKVASHETSNPTGAQPPSKKSEDPVVVTLNPYFESIALAPLSQYWEDPSGEATVTLAAEEGAFKPVEQIAPNFNYTDSAFWFRFRLQNETGDTTRLILAIPYPVLDRIKMCIGPRQGPWECREGGDALPFETREIRSPDHVFPIDLAKGENRWVYLGVKTSSSMRVPMTLSTTKKFESSQIISQLGWGLLFGWLFVMLIHNLLLWAVTRDKIYVLFSAHLAMGILFSAALSGHGFQYLWSDVPWLTDRSAPILVGLFGITSCLFPKFFLETKATSPKIDKGLLGLLVLFSAVALGGALGDVPTFTRIGLLAIVLASIFLLIAPFKIWFSGFRPARFLALANVAFTIGAITSVLRTIGVMQVGFIAEQGLNVGVAVQALMMAFALGDRIRGIAIEKETTKQAELEMVKERYRNLSEIRRVCEEIASVSQTLNISVASLITSGATVTQSVASVMDYANDLGEMVVTIKTSSQKIVSAAEDNASTAVDTTSAMEMSATDVSQIKMDADRIAHTSSDLLESVIPLSRTVRSVQSIAEQSKILAVNASIEAAMAGQYGAGFSDVAKEVKSLAEQSKEATIQIEAILSELRFSITKIAKMTRASLDKADASLRKIQDASSLATRLSKTLHGNARMAGEISSSLENNAARISDILSIIEEVEKAVHANQIIRDEFIKGAFGLDDNVKRLSALVGDEL